MGYQAMIHSFSCIDRNNQSRFVYRWKLSTHSINLNNRGHRAARWWCVPGTILQQQLNFCGKTTLAGRRQKCSKVRRRENLNNWFRFIDGGCLRLFFLFFLSFHIWFVIALVVLLLPTNSRESDLRSYSRLFFPLPTTMNALRFYREKGSALPSLVD